LVHDYLRSQDIEDPKSLIHDRIFMSDSDIYIASGYLYATGSDPASLNLHPPLIKYLFGLSAVLTGNPFYVQIVFGLGLLILTWFLGIKVFRSRLVASGAVFLLLIDPVFGAMMNSALLDLGNAFFGLGYLILVFCFPEAWIWQGIALGLFASSKFWSTAIIFTALIFGFKLIIQREKLNFRKIFMSFLVGLLVFALTYLVSFIKTGGMFNIFEYQGRVFRFMITHNYAREIGSPLILFISGYFAPWWTAGVAKAQDWSFLWPLGLGVGVFSGFREFWEKTKDIKLFIYLLPFIYLLLSSTQVPFTRYFIIILPFVYLGFAEIAIRCYHSLHGKR